MAIVICGSLHDRLLGDARGVRDLRPELLLPSGFRSRGPSIEKRPNVVDCGPHVPGRKSLVNEAGNLVLAQYALPFAFPIGLRIPVRRPGLLTFFLNLNVEASHDVLVVAAHHALFVPRSIAQPKIFFLFNFRCSNTTQAGELRRLVVKSSHQIVEFIAQPPHVIKAVGVAIKPEPAQNTFHFRSRHSWNKL